ncbi:MAG TPA: flagellar hook protein FlgE [Micropepsaceae bacterium]|nr:flagellar hook protein FlgE [Micropepsaceae bacterium]
MSLYGALFTGVSSLAANSRALGVSSNNIANVNTVGYKAANTQFSTLLATQTSAGSFSSGGVRAEPQAMVNRQGLLQSTESATDLAISGSGFFIVTATPEAGLAGSDLLYTRAGSFTTDSAGFLKNAAGYYLQGWRLDANGEVPTNRADLEPINLNELSGTAQATQEIDLRVNLQASEDIEAVYAAGDMNAGTVEPDFQRTLEVFDSQGGTQPLRVAFVKTAANTWQYEVIYDGNVANIGGAANNPVATGTLTFNTDGTLATPASSVSLTIPWDPSSGLSAQSIDIDFGTPGQPTGFTQYDSPSTLLSSTVDGALFGGLIGVKVDDDGYVTALFDNGVERRVFKLPIANFQNPNGLAAINGNAYRATDDSGVASFLEANVGGAGSIAASSLESSTVDLAKEFTDLITTQRAYSAATRIISTADQMLEEMLRIKR